MASANLTLFEIMYSFIKMAELFVFLEEYLSAPEHLLGCSHTLYNGNYCI